MSSAISRSEGLDAVPSRVSAGVAGGARLRAGLVDGETRVRDLYQRQPLRLFIPHAPADEPLMAVLGNSSGGIVGGDRHEIALRAEAETRVMLTGQAAEKVYRSAGADSRVDITLRADAGAWLEYLPQGTILFDGSRLRRVTRIDRHPDARVMAGEVLMLGRGAMGERLTTGMLRDSWRLTDTAENRLDWADSLKLDGDIAAPLGATAGFGGATAMGLCVLYARDAAALLDDARDMLGRVATGARCAATAFPNLLIARWLGEAAAVRASFGEFWASLRARAGGLPETLPTIWAI